MREATRLLEAAHGPSEKLEGTGGFKGWLFRFAFGWILKGRLREVKMSPLVKKIVVSLAFGIGAVTIMLQAALADGVVSATEWAEMLPAFVAAFWGKFSSNTTIIAPSRKGETIAGPAQ